MRKFYGIIILVISIVSSPFSAKADNDITQQIEGVMEKIEQTKSKIQEEIQTRMNEAQNLATQAKGVAGEIQQGVADMKEGVNPQKLVKVKDKVSKIDLKGKAEDADKAIEESYVKKQGEGNDTENFKKAQEETQEVLREAVSHLYAVGFTVRTNMKKEKPTDNNMTSTDQILQEANTKAMKCVQRLATIYTLEGLLQAYQMLEEAQNVTIDAAQQEEGEGKE